MAEEAQKVKAPVHYYNNNGGLNSRGSRFRTISGQARENTNCVYTKDGAFKGRSGQLKTNSTQPAGNPEFMLGINFRRSVSGTVTDKKMVYGNDGKIYNASVDPPTASLSGLTTSGVIPDFQVARGFLFFVDGVNTPKKFDGTTWTQWGITAPAAAPTVATGGAGLPNGTYRFRIAFERVPTGLDPGQISSMGTISASVTAANQIINLTNIPVSADAQVNSRRIYVEIAGQWYEAGSIADNVTTTFAYNALDSTTVLVGVLGRTDRDPPPSSLIYIKLLGSIMYGSDGKKLYWTTLDELESWSQLKRASNAFETDDGDYITALGGGTDLIVGKSRCVFLRSGDDVTYIVDKRIGDAGIASHHSVITYGRLSFYLAHDGFRVFDGNDSTLISGNIDDKLFGSATDRLLAASFISQVTGVAFSSNNLKALVWSIPSGLGESNNALVYFPDYTTEDTTNPSRQDTVGIWASWSNLDARSLFRVINSSSKQDEIYATGKNGFVRQLMTGYTDDGTAIACTYRAVEDYFDKPLERKRMRDALFQISMDDGVGAPPVPPKVEWYIDGASSGVIHNLNFRSTGDLYDSALYDFSHYAPEGGLACNEEFGANPFRSIGPKVTWNVSAQTDDILWNGWSIRIEEAGVRRNEVNP